RTQENVSEDTSRSRISQTLHDDESMHEETICTIYELEIRQALTMTSTQPLDRSWER
mgnify:CR=1